MPRSISHTNECRVIVDREPARDADRLEDLVADAAAAARRARAYLPQLDYDTFKRVEREMKYLANTIEKRQIPSEDFRTHVGIILDSLGDAPTRNDPEFVTNLSGWLETARILSHRVDDLINAEMEINQQRSNGRLRRPTNAGSVHPAEGAPVSTFLLLPAGGPELQGLIDAIGAIDPESVVRFDQSNGPTNGSSGHSSDQPIPT